METHAAVPQLRQFGRVRPQLGRVERRIAEPAAEDDAEDAEGDAGMNLFKVTLHRLRKLLDHDNAIDFTESLPRQDNGKIYKRLLRDRYWADHKNRIV